MPTVRKSSFGCPDAGTAPIVPNRKNRLDPWPFDEDEKATCKGRNCIERLFAKAKQFRWFATRYEKRKSMFVAVVQLVFGLIRMRKIAPRTVCTPPVLLYFLCRYTHMTPLSLLSPATWQK